MKKSLPDLFVYFVSIIIMTFILCFTSRCVSQNYIGSQYKYVVSKEIPYGYEYCDGVRTIHVSDTFEYNGDVYHIKKHYTFRDDYCIEYSVTYPSILKPVIFAYLDNTCYEHYSGMLWIQEATETKAYSVFTSEDDYFLTLTWNIYEDW